MFFRKKDFRHYQNKGEQLLASGHFAEARIAFIDALDRFDRNNPADGSEVRLRELLARAGNHLAAHNIEEAIAAQRAGDGKKAHEHLELAIELADDVTLREKADKLIAGMIREQDEVEPHAHGSSCTGCSSHRHTVTATPGNTDDFLSEHDRFELLMQTLPENLSSRYMGLGEKFASSYLLSSEGNHRESLARYLEILNDEESDIVLYEAAVQYHHLGDLPECEAFLERSYRLNSSNLLCCIGLVQLYCDTGRHEVALQLLATMIETGIEKEQALLYMGDIYRDTERFDKAIDCYSKMLAGPYARDAAERLVPLLEMSGRSTDAQALFKRYLKGCC